MKKTSLSLLFFTSLLISACNMSGEKPNDNNGNLVDNPNEENNSSEENNEEKKEEEEEDFSYLYILNDNEKPQCLVESKVKDYVDAMHEQSKKDNNLNEDKINDLHGDTIKVKKYYGNYDNSVPAEVRFEIDDRLKGESFKVRCWPKGEEENYKESQATDGAARFDNLYRGAEYEWRVISSSGKKSGIGTFYTADYPRILSVGKLFNVRDCGGWTTVDGYRVKQGLLYRGGEIIEKTYDTTHSKTVSEEGRKIFVNDLHIKHQIDLRNDTEIKNANGGNLITSCAMNEPGISENDPKYVVYHNLEIQPYVKGLAYYKDHIRTLFENYFTKLDKEPVYCNCYGGADRTGTVCFLLEALLGVPYTDLVIDYELTSFDGSLKQHDISDEFSQFTEMINYIKSYDFYKSTTTLKTVAETFLVDLCGVSKDAIAKIREIMLEEVETQDNIEEE